METSPIFLLTGTPGSGKSSVARALLERFEFGLHLPIDDVREFVVSGMAHPVPDWTAETDRQFWLARQSMAFSGNLYAKAGFAVVIDDVISSDDVHKIFEPAFIGLRFHKVLLWPGLGVALERNRTRTHKDFDTRILEQPIRGIHAWMQEHVWPEDWLRLDSGGLDVAQTVNAILGWAR